MKSFTFCQRSCSIPFHFGKNPPPQFTMCVFQGLNVQQLTRTFHLKSSKTKQNITTAVKRISTLKQRWGLVDLFQLLIRNSSVTLSERLFGLVIAATEDASVGDNPDQDVVFLNIPNSADSVIMTNVCMCIHLLMLLCIPQTLTLYPACSHYNSPLCV